MTRLVFLDCETTGLEPDRHEVYEIGLIYRDPELGKPDQEFRWWLPVDLAKADPVALSIGRYFERRPSVMASPKAPQVWWPGAVTGVVENAHDATEMFPEALMGLTAGAHLVGAVPSFDAAFLSRLLRANGCCPAWHYHLVDVEALAAGYLARMVQTEDVVHTLANLPWDSNELSRTVGVEPRDFDRHTALGDARWARAVYDKVMGNG